MERRRKVSTAVLVAVLVIPGLAGLSGLRDAARQATAPLDAEEVVADPGHCHGPPRELRFEWLKPGEEPMPTTHSSVCLAVYRN